MPDNVIFKIDSEIFKNRFDAILRDEMEEFNYKFKIANDKKYCIAVGKGNIWDKISQLNSTSEGLVQFISQFRNELDLNSTTSSLSIVEDFCKKNDRKVDKTILQIAEIAALYKAHDLISERAGSLDLIDHPKGKKIHEIKSIIISFEKIDLLYQNLKVYFSESEHGELLHLLEGGSIKKKLVFQFNANRFVELFRRIHYNGLISENLAALKKWILNNFRFKNEASGEVRDFNVNSTHATLYGSAGAQPRKKQRILTLDWLPIKSPSQLKAQGKNH